MIKRVVFITVFIIFAVFILQNTQVLEVRFWFWKTQASRALVLLITFLVGLGIGWLAGFWKKRSTTSIKRLETNDHSASPSNKPRTDRDRAK